MRIVISGGGTGGHVTPALAIAYHLWKTESDSEILFICREGGRENAPIEKAGYDIRYIKVQGLKRQITPKNVESILLAIKAARRAKKIIREFAPDAVIGTGGYVCWPVLHAAASLGIPTAIHESNSVPGLVTRAMARKCTRVLINFEETKQYLKRRGGIVRVGNPLRSDFTSKDKVGARKELGIRNDEIYVVSFGGSGGAERINEAILGLSDYYSDSGYNIRHIHAMGERYYAAMTGDKRVARQINAVPYIEDMPTHLLAADIAICRCGAMTLSELALSKTAAILIPSPNVTDDHQYKNARHFSDSGAALLLREDELCARTLFDNVEPLCKSRKMRESLAKKMASFSDPDAAKNVVRELHSIAER